MKLELQGTLCSFCNGKNLIHYSALAFDSPANSKKINIVECRECCVAWQWPLRRTEQQSATTFQDAYLQREENSYFDPVKRKEVATCQANFVMKKVQSPSRLLDIGCGDGVFSQIMAGQGWDVLGLDPALISPIDEAMSCGRLRLLNSQSINLPKHEMFNVVTLWDVVEHVEDPLSLIIQAVERLVPGGILIVETGNYQSASRVQSSGTWWNYQIDHRWYLAPPQLRDLLTRAGLNNIEMADRVLRPWWRGHCDIPHARKLDLVKAVTKRPWRFIKEWQCYYELSSNQIKWKNWGGLEIMAMVGFKL